MDRLAAIAAAPAFVSLPAAAREALAACLAEERHAPGSKLVSEGEPADRFYIITAGRAEVTAQGVPLRGLAAGDVFGEVALLAPQAIRTATITAIEAVALLVLSAADFHCLLVTHSEIRRHFEVSARQLLTFSFLKLASPFSSLDFGAIQALAQSMETLRIPAGEIIIRQGEAGDRAYCVFSGRVEVLRGQPAEHVAELFAGALFGEAALLTGAPRDATLRAIEETELLMLRREALIGAMNADPRVAAACLSLLRLRERPQRKAGVELREGRGCDGAPFFILVDRQRGNYFRLSVEGRFVWDRLDGEHDLKKITIDFFGAYKRFAPDTLAGLINALANAGFIQLRAVAAEVAAESPGVLQRLTAGASSWLNCQFAIAGCDPWLSRAYRSGIHRFYSKPALWLMTAIIIFGFAALLLQTGEAFDAVRISGFAPLLGWLIPAGFLAILAHEAGHAFTAKAFGREIHRIGIGWHWVAPVFFVDTSDMWLAGKWQRLAVSAAGIYVNLVLAGLAALAAWFSSGPTLAILWLFAVFSYAVTVLNLNPLADFDGYHMLADLLDRPNLRSEAIAWVRRRGPFTGHAAEALYIVLTVLYLFGLAAILLLFQGRL